jgi:hypothetical protein
VETRSLSRPDAPVLVYIQDAHGVYGAQYNASKILEGLRQSAWAGTAALPVYQEGGTGPAPVEWLASFPFEGIKERVAHAFLRRGDITGEEYRAVAAAPGAYRLVGVETETLYKKNLAARHETASARQDAEKAIVGFQSRLAVLKSALYPAPLKVLDKATDAFARQETSFVDYASALVNAAPKNLSLSNYPNLDRLNRLMAWESALDLRALSDERDRLVRQLASFSTPETLKTVVARATEVRQGTLPPIAFYEGLLTLADQLGRQGRRLPTPSLRDYVAYLNLSESLNHSDLLSEAENLRVRLFDRYAGDARLGAVDPDGPSGGPRTPALETGVNPGPVCRFP